MPEDAPGRRVRKIEDLVNLTKEQRKRLEELAHKVESLGAAIKAKKKVKDVSNHCR